MSPVDTRATSYIWYFDVPEEDRLIRVRWTPFEEAISSSMALGTLRIETKPGGKDAPWIEQEAHTIPDCLWAVAENLARRSGFTVEVPQYA